MDLLALIAIGVGVLVLPVLCRRLARRYQRPDTVIDTLIHPPVFSSSPNAGRILRMKARR